MLVGGALALALAALTVWLAPAWPWLVVAFALLGAFLAADSASFLNIILEFCADEDRPTYIGLTNTLLAPVTDAGAAARRLAGGAAGLPADVRARGAAGLPRRGPTGRLGT